MENKWLSWICAPRDGSNIIALYDDYSGTVLLYWGESTGGEEGWVEADGCWEGKDVTYAGWIPCPYIPEHELARFGRFGIETKTDCTIDSTTATPSMKIIFSNI